MTVKTISIFIVMLLNISIATAEVFRCETDSKQVIYSDEPCGDGGKYKQKTINLDSHQPASKAGHSLYAGGMISGHGDTLDVQDSVAYMKESNKTIYVNLWLYPFRLNKNEIAQVKNSGIIHRSAQKPIRVSFSFPADLSNVISYKKISSVGISTVGGEIITASATQWNDLIQSLRLEFMPNQGRLSFELKGNIEKYSVDIKTNTYLYGREEKVVRNKKIENTNALMQSSVFGLINFPYKVRADLLEKKPAFSVKDLKTNKWVNFKNLNYDAATRSYSISGLRPSKYMVNVGVGKSTEFIGSAVKPNEMYARTEFIIQDENTPVRADLDMVSLMQLTKPVNNRFHIPGKELKSYPGPLEFVWQPLDEGTVYKCVIKRVNKVKNHTSLDIHMAIDVRNPNLTVNLTPGLYHFVLSAYKNGIKSGEMRIHDAGEIRFEYVFLVE